MADKRYVIAYDGPSHERVQLAPESYGADLLTKAEAAERIVGRMSALIEDACKSRRIAAGILRRERRAMLHNT